MHHTWWHQICYIKAYIKIILFIFDMVRKFSKKNYHKILKKRQAFPDTWGIKFSNSFNFWNYKFSYHRVRIGMTLTRDGAEEAEGGSLAWVLVDHAFAGGLRHWDGEGDRLVELAAAWFNSNYWRDSYSIAQKFSNQVSRDWLGL